MVLSDNPCYKYLSTVTHMRCYLICSISLWSMMIFLESVLILVIKWSHSMLFLIFISVNYRYQKNIYLYISFLSHILSIFSLNSKTLLQKSSSSLIADKLNLICLKPVSSICCGDLIDFWRVGVMIMFLYGYLSLRWSE
jgi:hypothetical protein